MRHLAITAFVFVIGFLSSATAQEQQPQAQQPMASIASMATLDALQDCLKKSTTEEMLECVVLARINVKPMHFYTGEYTRYSVTDYGPRYDPRDWPYERAALDMCKQYAPEIKKPVVRYHEFNSVSGGCCGYAFFVMACIGLN